jgi:signal transduction histidine kinase
MAALSLFRIAQEALRNASRHGHAQRVTVSLTRNEDALTLSIADDGVGFAPETAGHGGGLGLMSIEERALLLNGRLTVRSQPLQGTTIEARVPLDIEANPQPADVERKQTPPLAPARDERSPSRSPTVKSSG